MEKDNTGQPLTTGARSAMVQGWFMRRLLARQKFEQGLASWVKCEPAADSSISRSTSRTEDLNLEELLLQTYRLESLE